MYDEMCIDRENSHSHYIFEATAANKSPTTDVAAVDVVSVAKESSAVAALVSAIRTAAAVADDSEPAEPPGLVLAEMVSILWILINDDAPTS
uniref:Uncharacterized protein n=1 Tax=Romanomermis culicivorax TaxID=13658 RepID=A0A915IFL0_ROMCU